MHLTAPPLPDRLLRVRCGPGYQVPIAVRFRPGGDDLLVCLHGLGCAKECFDSGLEDPGLTDRVSFLTFDFPGHGGSGAPPPVGDPIQAYADLTVTLVRRFATGRVFLLCHSMGGAIGLLASQELPRLSGFLSVEGNLTGQDCGLVSRRAADAPVAQFVDREFPRFRDQLAAADRADLRRWGDWFARADPAALHRLARSLVEWSDSGKLLGLLTSLPRAAYLYGADSQVDLGQLLSSLDGVPAQPVAGSRHFPMLDNPCEFWGAVAAYLARW